MRTCLFCDDRHPTREHAWPQWLTKRFPATGAGRIFAERRGDQPRDWEADLPELVVKWLCGSCNNGWMSRLEAEAKPIIVGILDGKVNELDTQEQRTLGVWAVKTAMVLEALDPSRQWFYSAAEREQMRLMRSVPPRSSVCIAQCKNHTDIYSAAMNHGTDNGVVGFSVTMAFDFLAFHVVTVRVPDTVPAQQPITYAVSDGPWDQILVPVWPVADVPRKWRGVQGLNGDVGLNALTERLCPLSLQGKPGSASGLSSGQPR